MADGKIICAVDFGTTYSGVAYAYVEKDADPQDVEIELIEDHWPGQTSSSSAKVPTVFKFDKTAPGGFKWGFQLEDDVDGICFAKLYLDPKQIEAAETLGRFSKKLGKLPPNRKVTDVVSRYLGALRDVALDRMRADWGDDFVESHPVEYILTVPAVWSDKAKSDTLACAAEAGFGGADKIRLITEPEAAAVYTFHQLPDARVKVGDVFITCDCGGGTVDLTTYKVAQTDPVLRVDEMTQGGGGLGGSVYLNKRFEELVQSKIGKQLDGLPKSEVLEAMAEINKVFNDDIKTDFGVSDDPDKTYSVPVPIEVKSSPTAPIIDGHLTITSSEVSTVFDAVINIILDFLVQQLERVDEHPESPEVSAILLVGGFGSSEYLRKKIAAHFDGEALPKIDVIQPVNAWSAVTRGAMLRGVQGNIVQSRIIRNYYGISFKTEWDPDVHEAPERKRTALKHKYFDEFEQVHKCNNCMRWYVKRGDVFSDSKVVRFSFYRTLTNLTNSNLVFLTDLLIYSGPGEAPFFKDNDCKVVATLKSDLSKVPHDSFEMVNSGGGSYYKVSYELEMRLEAAISFRLIFDGKVIGEIAADYGRS